MIKLFRINTGSCGGCDIEIGDAVRADAGLSWAATPQEADVLLLTGPLTMGSRAALRQLLHDAAGAPLLAIGRCAIDGHPFGKGGVQEAPEIVAQARLDGCPPSPDAIAAAIRAAVQGTKQ